MFLEHNFFKTLAIQENKAFMKWFIQTRAIGLTKKLATQHFLVSDVVVLTCIIRKASAVSVWI